MKPRDRAKHDDHLPRPVKTPWPVAAETPSQWLRRHLHRHRRSALRLYRGGGRSLLVLLVVLAAMGVAVLVVARLDAMRLSATAAAAITTRSVTGGSSFDQSPSGTWLTYSYAVDGTTFSGKTFRRWINVDARQPKICYDPSEPGRHLLVEGSYVCGSGG